MTTVRKRLTSWDKMLGEVRFSLRRADFGGDRLPATMDREYPVTATEGGHGHAPNRRH